MLVIVSQMLRSPPPLEACAALPDAAAGAAPDPATGVDTWDIFTVSGVTS
jgi:hypothetical protein